MGGSLNGADSVALTRCYGLDCALAPGDDAAGFGRLIWALFGCTPPPGYAAQELTVAAAPASLPGPLAALAAKCTAPTPPHMADVAARLERIVAATAAAAVRAPA